MSKRKIIALVLGLPFAALSTYAVIQVGYWGIFAYHRHSPAGWQVFADLVVALVLIASWMIVDARNTSRRVWPYLVGTLLLGSLAPLAYLLLSPNDAETDVSTDTIGKHSPIS